MYTHTNLSEWALANKWVDLVAVQPLLPVLHNVVVIVVVIAVIVHLALFFGAGVFRRNLLGSPFLFRVIHLRSKEKVLISDPVLLLHEWSLVWNKKTWLTSLMCLYVLMRSTESFRSGALAGSRKLGGILLCRMVISDSTCKSTKKTESCQQWKNHKKHKTVTVELCAYFINVVWLIRNQTSQYKEANYLSSPWPVHEKCNKGFSGPHAIVMQWLMTSMCAYTLTSNKTLQNIWTCSGWTTKSASDRHKNSIA